jgi:transcriptional regulator with XRE-family HTH domain
MTIPPNSQPSSEDILYAFAVEPIPGRDTLEKYLQDYPEYADELIDLSYELSREVRENEITLSAEDLALIDKALKQHAEAVSSEIINPVTSISVDQQKELARLLGVPRQVISAFLSDRVELVSVPRHFLKKFASILNSTVEILFDDVTRLSPRIGLSTSYKADDRPNNQTSTATFEQLLIDANVPPDKRSLLMQNESQDG